MRPERKADDRSADDYLSPAEADVLLRIARGTLESCVHSKRLPDLTTFSLTPTLREKRGAFVTLRNEGVLRGCIGYTMPRAPLAEAVQANVVNAARHDSRFSPVTPDELERIDIEISALTSGDTADSPFRRVRSTSEIRLGHDGLFVRRKGERGGILLPQVPEEYGWDVGQFLQAVCRKAGYADDAWEAPDVEIYRFSAQVISERPDEE